MAETTEQQQTAAQEARTPAAARHEGIPVARQRLAVQKTYKVYIGGKFPRTESGRYYVAQGPDGGALANVCLCTRKDFREAVLAARAAQEKWAGSSAFLRGQILYRIAEMLEGRRAQFVAELETQGSSRPAAEAETDATIDRIVYYAGWADKYQQVFSSVNPVASSHFNFSVCEPTGVVSVAAPESSGLLGLVSAVIPVITGANTCIVLASTARPLCAVTWAEVLHASDLPGGVINILTGRREELLTHMASHMDVNAVIGCEIDAAALKLIQEQAVANVKRVIIRADESEWNRQDPYLILDTQETKTTWHPIGQ